MLPGLEVGLNPQPYDQGLSATHCTMMPPCMCACIETFSSFFIFVQAMWMMLQQEKADDFVIATNEVHSVREFVEESFKHIGVDIA